MRSFKITRISPARRDLGPRHVVRRLSQYSQLCVVWSSPLTSPGMQFMQSYIPFATLADDYLPLEQDVLIPVSSTSVCYN